jgi:hypothetical protein
MCWLKLKVNISASVVIKIEFNGLNFEAKGNIGA